MVLDRTVPRPPVDPGGRQVVSQHDASTAAAVVCDAKPVEHEGTIVCPLTGRMTRPWASSEASASSSLQAHKANLQCPPLKQPDQLLSPRPPTREGDYGDELDWRRAHTAAPLPMLFTSDPLGHDLTLGLARESLLHELQLPGTAKSTLRSAPRSSTSARQQSIYENRPVSRDEHESRLSRHSTPVWRLESPRDPSATERLYRGEKAPPESKVAGRRSPRRRRRQGGATTDDLDRLLMMTHDLVDEEWGRTTSMQPGSKRIEHRMRLLNNFPHLREDMQRVVANHRKAKESSGGQVVDFLKRNASTDNFTREGLEKQKQEREGARAQHSARCAARSKPAEPWAAA